MPRASRTAFKDDEVVVAWSTFTTAAVPGQPVVTEGMRLRGDHPVVKACPARFLREVTARRMSTRAAASCIPKPRRPRLSMCFPKRPRRLRDDEVLIATEDSAGVPVGQRASKKDPRIKAQAKSAFVELNPHGVKRTDALVCLTTLKNVDVDGNVSVCHQGTWQPRDSEWVRLYPAHFALPEPEERS